MKNHVLIVLAGLCLALSGNCARAQNQSSQTQSHAVALYNDDAPTILNDLVCVKECDDRDPVCSSAASRKPDGRCF